MRVRYLDVKIVECLVGWIKRSLMVFVLNFFVIIDFLIVRVKNWMRISIFELNDRKFKMLFFVFVLFVIFFINRVI